MGTGLTTADLLISLNRNGHRGSVTALSRRGLLPSIHQEARSYPSYIENHTGDGAESLTTAGLMQLIRDEVRRGTADGYNWRSIIDALRPHLRHLWMRLPEAERHRFLRHVRPYWEVHRHRMAPQVAQFLDTEHESGRLTVLAGRLRSLTPEAGGLRAVVTPRGNGSVRELPAGWVINCSGPACDYARIGHPLIRSLLDGGLARPDALGLGLDVTPEGIVIGADGGATEGLYALGPVTRGTFWEITAVPELRVQCAGVAEALT
jgi:uncharacterized NAD(P)/FAD-binding protein YdhS